MAPLKNDNNNNTVYTYITQVASNVHPTSQTKFLYIFNAYHIAPYLYIDIFLKYWLLYNICTVRDKYRCMPYSPQLNARAGVDTINIAHVLLVIQTHP